MFLKKNWPELILDHKCLHHLLSLYFSINLEDAIKTEEPMRASGSRPGNGFALYLIQARSIASWQRVWHEFIDQEDQKLDRCLRTINYDVQTAYTSLFSFEATLLRVDPQSDNVVLDNCLTRLFVTASWTTWDKVKHGLIITYVPVASHLPQVAWYTTWPTVKDAFIWTVYKLIWMTFENKVQSVQYQHERSR